MILTNTFIGVQRGIIVRSGEKTVDRLTIYRIIAEAEERFNVGVPTFLSVRCNERKYSPAHRKRKRERKRSRYARSVLGELVERVKKSFADGTFVSGMLPYQSAALSHDCVRFSRMRKTANGRGVNVPLEVAFACTARSLRRLVRFLAVWKGRRDKTAK